MALLTAAGLNAEEPVAAVHNRMPVILGPEHYQWWLQPDRFEPQFLKSLLRPYPAEDMACVHAVDDDLQSLDGVCSL